MRTRVDPSDLDNEVSKRDGGGGTRVLERESWN